MSDQKKITISDKYQSLWDSEARYHIVTGGRGSGKSFGVSLFLLSTLHNEKGHKILFTRYTLTSAKTSIIPQFIEVMELMNMQDYFEVNADEIKSKRTGSVIIFKGIKTSSGIQTANLKSLTGVTTWVLDEAEELVDEETFTKIDYSVRVKSVKNRVIMVMNPSTKEHWIYQRFFSLGEQQNTNYIHTTYLDNIDNLSDDVLEDYKRLKKVNINKYNHIVLGGWLNKAEGVIFENWKEGEFQNFQLNGYGLDYGYYPDPTAFVKASIDKHNKRIYLKELFYKTKLENDELIRNIHKTMDSGGMVVCDNTEKRTTAVIRDSGIRIKETKKKAGSVIEGIKLMQEYELIISPDSHNLRRELNNYVWHDKKSDLPIDDYNHLLDSARYIITDLIKATGRVQAIV